MWATVFTCFSDVNDLSPISPSDVKIWSDAEKTLISRFCLVYYYYILRERGLSSVCLYSYHSIIIVAQGSEWGLPVRSVKAPELTEVPAVHQVEKLPWLVAGETLPGGEVSQLSSGLVVTPGLVPSPPVALDYPHLGAGTSSVQTVVVRPDLPGLSDGEDLVAPQPVAGGDPQPAARLAAHRVQAAASSRDGAQVEVVEGQLGLRVNRLQIPPERFALKLLPQFLSGRDVPPVNFPRHRVETEVEIFPVVHPDLGQSGVVMVDDLRGSPREGVGCCLSEDVTHPAAGGD